MGLYGAGGYAAGVNGIFERLLGGTYGNTAGMDPYGGPYASSTFPGASPGVGGQLLLDMFVKSQLGTRNLFRIPSWSEPAAGELGAYAYSRFRGNSAAFRGVSAAARATSRTAFAGLFTGSNIVRGLFHLDDENAKKVASGMLDDESGFVDMGANMIKEAFGLQDYGYAGTSAARRRSGMLVARMDRNARRILADIDPSSNAWTSREAAMLTGYQRAVQSAMYKKDAEGNDTFWRNEEFMRGFKETDIAPILERVAASSKSTDNLDARIREVGGAAIKTLEAFKDLFGNAEDAKRMLNQITSGGFSGMNADTLNSITNRTRGLMRLGELNGLSPQAVASVLNVTQMGVQSAMGFSGADIAGGYVPQNLTGSIAGRFVAQQLSDMGVSESDMNPVELQQLRARSLWRATQFAGSSAGRAMTAFQHGVMTGAIRGPQAERIKALFASGDTSSMAAAARMTARALGVAEDRLQSDSYFKIAATAVGQDVKNSRELANLGAAASENEDRSFLEQTLASEAISQATDAALESGMSRDEVNEVSRKAIIGRAAGLLKNARSAGGMRASGDLNRLISAGKSNKEIVDWINSVADSGMLGGAMTSRLRSETAAAVATDLYGRASNARLSDLSNEVVEFIRDNGGDAGPVEGVARSDAMALLKNLGRSKAFKTANSDVAGAVADVLSKGSKATDAEVRQALNAAVQVGGLDYVTGISFNKRDFGNLGSTTLFGAEIADALDGLKVDTYYTTGGAGVTQDYGDIEKGLGAVVDALSSSALKDSGDIKKRIGKDKELKAAYARLKKAKDLFAAASTSEAKRQIAASVVGDAKMLGISGNAAVEALHGSNSGLFADVGDAFSFVEAVTGTNRSGTDVTFGGRHLRKEQLEAVFSQAAKGIDGLDGRSYDDIIKQLQSGSKSEAVQKFKDNLRALGENAVVAADANYDVKTAFGTAAMAGVSDRFGGGLVTNDYYARVAMGAGERSGMTLDKVEELGARVQAIVDDNAVRAYTRASDAVLKGLQTNNWEDALDAFMDPGATKEQRAAFIKKVKERFKGFFGDDGKLKKNVTVAELASAVGEVAGTGELREIASASVGDNTDEAAANRSIAMVQLSSDTVTDLAKQFADEIEGRTLRVTEAGTMPA